jgi:hypothetical protein
MTKQKTLRLIGLIAYVFLAIGAILIFRPLYIYSILIVLVPPSLINFWWLKNSRLKVLVFSLASTLLFAPPIELMARLLNVWDVQSIFIRPLGLIPLENMLFAFLNFFWVLSFYEYFIDNDRRQATNKRFKYLIGLYVLFASLVFGLYFYRAELVAANYFTIAVIVLIIPGILIFRKQPKILKKTIIPTVFFALIFFVYELASLKLGSWFWPGNYFLSFKIFGSTFPLDDIIIWYFLSTPVLIGGYEFFIDDHK